MDGLDRLLIGLSNAHWGIGAYDLTRPPVRAPVVHCMEHSSNGMALVLPRAIMSITQLLREDQTLRAELRGRFKYPRFPLQAELVAPALSSSYSTVGTAVDYLLRGKVEFLNPGRVSLNQALIGEYGYSRLTMFLKRVGKGRVALGRKHRLILPANKVLRRVDEDYERSRTVLMAYGRNGLLCEEVVNAALFFARLDPFYRAGVIDPGLIEPDEHAHADVSSVIRQAPDGPFIAQKHCYLNPDFGKASLLVEGADADLIVDDLLLEIKTTKDLGVRREHLDQLLSYYVLHKIGGVNEMPRSRPIKRVGIYFSRHALLWSVPVEELASTRALTGFKRWFEGHYG